MTEDITPHVSSADTVSTTNQLHTIGFALLLTPLLFGFVLQFVVAGLVTPSIVDNHIVATILLFAPNVIGGAMVIFGVDRPTPVPGDEPVPVIPIAQPAA